MKKLNYLLIILLSCVNTVFAQEKGNVDNLPVHEYTITIKEEMVNMAGKEVKGMTVNGTIPGPTLQFTEGEYAIINVKNEMKEETSVHWHGLLVPNFYDGVPYLSTPPIKPGTTLKYEFPIKQSGTYWYHSHTMLQEQSGVFGSIVINPKKKVLDYDKDLVLMLSDWTNEKPMNVLRNLKRGNEWYQMKKGTATPLNKVIARGALGAQVDFWRQRMEGADIADVYYPAFLINGKKTIEYSNYKPGEKIRLRIINGAASTQFWMTFGGEAPMLVSADGHDVVPVAHRKTFIGIAETYDFIITVPENGKIEFRTMAQDGSGTASAYIGNGKILPAEILPKPDKIEMMQKMAKMDMKMGAHALKYRPNKDERYKMKAEYGMQMDGMNSPAEQAGMGDDKMKMDDSKMKMDMSGDSKMDHSKMKMDMSGDYAMSNKMNHSKMKMGDDKMKMDMSGDSKMDHSKMKMEDGKMKMDDSKAKTGHEIMKMDMSGGSKMDGMKMDGMDLFSEYNYDFLRSPVKTNFDKSLPVKEVLLNLTGNMKRYIWSMNGVPLSEADKIKISAGEVTRITFNNLTMMHHPMHLHGHFFRVLNKNGDYSPLKHTVNVPPMQQVTIEFSGNNGDESGDWFLHCHILYHLMGGMARVVSYDTPRDPRMKDFPLKTAVNETDKFYTWSLLNITSNMASYKFTSSNIRNQFNGSFEYGWNKNLEGEVTYERYLHDYFRVFGGINVENKTRNSVKDLKTTAVVGVRFLTPYLFSLDARVDSDLRPRISLGRSIMLFPRFAVFGYYEYQMDFGFVNKLPVGRNFESETVWNAGGEYFLSRNFSLMASYDNRYGAGGGLSIRF